MATKKIYKDLVKQLKSLGYKRSHNTKHTIVYTHPVHNPMYLASTPGDGNAARMAQRDLKKAMQDG